jgi:hypothetical protein
MPSGPQEGVNEAVTLISSCIDNQVLHEIQSRLCIAFILGPSLRAMPTSQRDEGEARNAHPE